MNRGVLAFLIVVLAGFISEAHADDSASDKFAIAPSADITLYRGEKIDLSVMDNRGKTPVAVDPSKITWEIDGQPAAKLDISEGSFSASGGAGGVAVYRTPLRKPANNTLTLTATIVDGADKETAKGFITITDTANWFAIAGDTGMGPKAYGIDLDPAHSTVSMQTSFVDPNKPDLAIHIAGSEKGSFGDLTVDLSLGSNPVPGTYAWSASPESIGLDISIDRENRSYGSTDLGVRNETSTVGETTLMKPRTVDPPGLVKGFFSGRLCWGDVHNHYFPRYLTVHGHFAVQGHLMLTATPVATAPAAAPPAAAPAAK